MKRSIISIDETTCDGCGLCVKGCAEGALAIIDGKARLVSETYCDGLGACLGECPQGAITIEQRDAADFDEAAVAVRQRELGLPVVPPGHAASASSVSVPAPAAHGGGCPGSMMRSFAPVQPAVHQPVVHQHGGGCPGSAARAFAPIAVTAPQSAGLEASQLSHWPIQLRLLNPAAPFLRGADLLLCADCAPFTIPDFHSRYLTGRAVAIGCPKLDDLPEAIERLTAIITDARPSRITVLRMEVPCCGGLAMAALKARDMAGVRVPIEIHTASIKGGGIRVEAA